MSAESSQRLEEIRLVMKEKDEMVRVAHEILSLYGDYPESSSGKPHPVDKLAVRKGIMESVKHLSNIGGFCDSSIRTVIFQIETILGVQEIEPLSDPRLLYSMMVMAIGVQVDFTKRPFRALGFDVKAVGNRFSAIMRR